MDPGQPNQAELVEDGGSPVSRRSSGQQGGPRGSTDGDGRSPAVSSLRAMMSPGSELTRNSIAHEHDDEAELRKAAAEEAYARWRAGESSTKQKKFKPHRLAVIEDEGTLKEVDVKKMTVEDNKGVVSKAMATQDPDYQPFLERLHRRMQQ